MLMNQAINLMEKLVDEIREAPPERRDHFMNMTLSLVAMGAEAFRTNPEFRRELAKLLNQEIQAYLEKS